MHVSPSIPVLLIACISCQAANISRSMNVAVGSFRVSAEISRYKYKRVIDNECTFVYGRVSVENSGALAEAFAFDALRLSFDDTVSTGAYVDGGVAYVIPSIIVNGGTAIRKDVYWVLNGRVPPPQLNEAGLLYTTRDRE